MSVLNASRSQLVRGVSQACRKVALRMAAFVLMATLAAPASADPLTLILLKLLRDQIITRTLEAAYDRTMQSTPEQPVPGPSLFTLAPASIFAPALSDKVDDQQIRQLIDDGFVHLTAAQREEVYASVQRILSDPAHAPDRRVILEELASKALAVRQAHDRLKQLTAADRQRVAEEARAEYARLPIEERQQLVQVLRQGTAPIPRDLSDSLLAAFSSVGGQ